MHKSAFLILLIVVGIGALSFYLITNPGKFSNKPATKPASTSADKYTLKTPDPSLKPEFTISGSVINIEGDHSSIDVIDDATKKTYTVIVPPTANIQFQNFPTEQNIAPKKLVYKDILASDQVTVIAENFAGNSTIQAKIISISKFNRVGKNLPI